MMIEEAETSIGWRHCRRIVWILPREEEEGVKNGSRKYTIGNSRLGRDSFYLIIVDSSDPSPERIVSLFGVGSLCNYHQFQLGEIAITKCNSV